MYKDWGRFILLRVNCKFGIKISAKCIIINTLGLFCKYELVIAYHCLGRRLKYFQLSQTAQLYGTLSNTMILSFCVLVYLNFSSTKIQEAFLLMITVIEGLYVMYTHKF